MMKTIDLRGLRLRMGWTASDLARRLGVTSAEVTSWEQQHQIPQDFDTLTRIEFLLRQADMCTDEMKGAPLAESLLEETHCEQIDFDRVKEKMVN